MTTGWGRQVNEDWSMKPATTMEEAWIRGQFTAPSPYVPVSGRPLIPSLDVSTTQDLIDKYKLGGQGGTTQPPTPPPPTTPVPKGVNSYYDANGYLWTLDELGEWVRSGFDPTKAYNPPEQTYGVPTGRENITWDSSGNEYMWSTRTGQYERTGGYDQTKDISYQQTQAWNQQQLGLEQQKLQWGQQQATAQLEADKQARLAGLAAQPKSWLEYAAQAGTTPQIQPWMLPLQAQNYGWRVGEPIPGYTPTNMTGMPSLLQPSAQLMGRMGPTAQQQYYGYQQGQTGATPEETAFRMWSQSPPAGRGSNVYWQR